MNNNPSVVSLRAEDAIRAKYSVRLPVRGVKEYVPRGRVAEIIEETTGVSDLLKALKSTLSTLDFAIQKGVLECHGVREAAVAAIAKAEGRDA